MTFINYISFFYIFIIGITLGSFLNVLIYRSHTGEPWWKGRSFCPTCKRTLSWRELIPIFSYLIQQGKCRGCKKRISVQYPLVEVASGILFIYLFKQYGIGGQFVLLSIIGLFLLGSFVSDLLYMELYEIFMIPGIILSIAYSLIYKEVTTQNLLIGLAFGFGFFALQYILTRGRGIGSGDLRLGLIMGALLGWPLVLPAIMISYIGGSLVSLTLLALGKLNSKSAIPLGVFLIPGLIITFLFRAEILVQVQSYLSGFTYIF